MRHSILVMFSVVNYEALVLDCTFFFLFLCSEEQTFLGRLSCLLHARIHFSAGIDSLWCGIRARWSHHLRLFSFMDTFRDIIINSWHTSRLLLLLRNVQPKILLKIRFSKEDCICICTDLLMPMFYWRTLLQKQHQTCFRCTVAHMLQNVFSACCLYSCHNQTSYYAPDN